MIETLKNIVRQKNRDGKLLWVRKVYEYPGILIRFHSLSRFRNFWDYRLRTLLSQDVTAKKQAGGGDQVFYELVNSANSRRAIMRIPRFDESYGCSLRHQLKDDRAFEDYRRILQTASDDPVMGRHFPEVSDVRRDGGYTATLVRGYGLWTLRDRLRDGRGLPSDVEAADLVAAVDVLTGNLRKYQKAHHTLSGEWKLNNLIYGVDDHRVYNARVDSCYTTTGKEAQERLAHLDSELEFIREMARTLMAESTDDVRVCRVLSAIGYASTADVAYSGDAFSIGYHSLSLGGRYFRGQRDCAARLEQVPYDFSGKTVLDLGTNRGGMLHCLADRIKTGIGVDYDYKCINAATLVKELNGTDNLHFYTFDMDREDLGVIDNFLLDNRVDICFLLAICLWVRNWRNVIKFAARTADKLLFETHGTEEQKREQLDFVRSCYGTVSLVSARSSDDPGQKERSLYLCSGALINDVTKKADDYHRKRETGQNAIS